VKYRSEKILNELGKVSNQSKIVNASSSSAIVFMEESISEATSERERADNIAHQVEQIFNKTQNAESMVDNHTKIITDLSNDLSEFNNGLDQTRIQIGQDNVRINSTRGETEKIKVLLCNVFIVAVTSELVRIFFFLAPNDH
jgi:septal ring factor EnvC (AmiA/AmiB activator)